MQVSDEARLLCDVARALNTAAGPAAARLPPLLFVTDGPRTPEPRRIAERLPAGSGVIFRPFGLAEDRETARALRAATRSAGVKLLVSRDAALARAVGADGLHLPESDLVRADAERAAWPEALITGAIHAAEGARVEGVDALFLSPIFAAGGRSGARDPLGPDAIEAAVRARGLPVYALGGINAGTASTLIGSGACGLAGVDAVIRAFAPAA